MDYKGRDANKHLTLTIGLATVTQGRWNDSDFLTPFSTVQCRDLSCGMSAKPVTLDHFQ